MRAKIVSQEEGANKTKKKKRHTHQPADNHTVAVPR